MKILVGLNNKNILDYLDYTKSFIIGLKDFSINYLEYSLDEIIKLRNDYPDIEIFVSINKNIFNKDLEVLETNLKLLSDIKINGLLFYDLSIVYLCRKNNIDIPLIWGQEHMTTNYNTCNYYYDKGCMYTLTSSEITASEIEEIHNNSKIKLIGFIFGYPDVSFSKRKLLTNYFLHENKKNDKDFYVIESESEKYFIKENKLGTRIVYGNVLNGIKPFMDLQNILDYGILSEEFIDHDIFIKCLSIFKKLNDNKINLEDAFDEIGKLTNSMDTVFYYRKTIYKVKDENKN